MKHSPIDHPANAGLRRYREPYPAGQPSFDLDEIGEEWVFCGWLRGEEAWCRAAFELAGGTE